MSYNYLSRKEQVVNISDLNGDINLLINRYLVTPDTSQIISHTPCPSSPTTAERDTLETELESLKTDIINLQNDINVYRNNQADPTNPNHNHQLFPQAQ